jgi:hypothetical protein
MEMSHLLIWFNGGERHAVGLTALPEAFAYTGKLFQSIPEYLGDADYLRDERNQLVGFSYILGNASEREEAVHAALIGQSEWVKSKNGMLVILLQLQQFEIECVQAVGTRLYRSESNEFMLAVPNCGFNPLGFELDTRDLPVAVV